MFECHSSLSFVIVRCSELIRVCALQTAFHWVVLGVAFDKISVVLNTRLFCVCVCVCVHVCVWCVCLCVCVCMCACAESGWFQCDQHWWRQSAVPLCRDGQVMGHHPTVPAWSAVQGLHCLFFFFFPSLPALWVGRWFVFVVCLCLPYLFVPLTFMYSSLHAGQWVFCLSVLRGVPLLNILHIILLLQLCLIVSNRYTDTTTKTRVAYSNSPGMCVNTWYINSTRGTSTSEPGWLNTKALGW